LVIREVFSELMNANKRATVSIPLLKLEIGTTKITTTYFKTNIWIEEF